MEVRRMVRIARAVLWASFAFVLTSFHAPSVFAADPVWSWQADDDIVFQRLTPLGSLLVSTGSGLNALDPATGKVQWTNAELKNLKECNYDELVNSQLGLIDAGQGVGGTKRKVIAIDLATGQPRWDSESLPFMSSQGVMQAPQKGMLIFAGVHKKGGKSVICGVDAETGAMKWQQEKMFTKELQLKEVKGSGKIIKRYSIEGNQQPIYPTDDTAILYLNEEGLVKIDLNTGEKLWVAPIKSKQAPALSDGYAQMWPANGVVYVPFEKSMQAVDISTGKLLWAKPPKFKSHVVQIAMTSHGLVVRGAPAMTDGPKPKVDGKPFIDVLDLQTGESKWKKPFRDLDDATTFDIRDDQLYIAADGDLFAVNLGDGSPKAVAKVKFRGNEVPQSLEVSEGNYVLSSSQNLMMVDPSGSVKFHEFYSAPGQSGWIKVLSTAAVMAVNAASAAQAHSMAMQNPGTTYTYTISGNPELSRRFKASQSGAGFQSILTSVEEGGKKGVGLVKLDKSTGKKVTEVILGDKTPEYQMDPIDNRVFFQRTDRQIDCFAF